jgi:hypothetical protein
MHGKMKGRNREGEHESLKERMKLGLRHSMEIDEKKAGKEYAGMKWKERQATCLGGGRE